MKLMDKAQKADYVEHLDRVKECYNEQYRKSTIKYYMTYDYIELDTGEVLSVPKTNIQSQFWYNDELEDPLPDNIDARKDFFVNLNMERFDDLGFKSWKDNEEAEYRSSRYVPEPFIVTTDTHRAANTTFVVFCDHWGQSKKEQWEERGADVRVLERGELEELGAIMDELRGKFAKRLATYWKRYSNKITSHGYWANR